MMPESARLYLRSYLLRAARVDIDTVDIEELRRLIKRYLPPHQAAVFLQILDAS